MIKPNQTPLFQERARLAHEAVAELLSVMTQRWAKEDATASPDGETFVLEMVMHPFLAGACRPLAEVAWDTSAVGSTVDYVLLAFNAAARDGLEEVAEERPAGHLTMQGITRQ